MKINVEKNGNFQSLDQHKKNKFLKKISRYKKNDYIQYSNFYETDLSTEEFYTIMFDLEQNMLVSKVLEVYSPFTNNSTGHTLDDINLNDEIYCDETDEEFTVSSDNIKVKFRVMI